MKAKVFLHTKTGTISWYSTNSNGEKTLIGDIEEWMPLDLTNPDDLELFVRYIEHKTARRIREESR